VRRFNAAQARWGLVLVAFGFGALLYALGLPHNPPGFYKDESAIAYNALSISESGRDEHGAAWPVFFESFGDYKSAPLVYLLAGFFKLTGPSILVARAVSAAVGLTTAILVGVLALRVGGSALVGYIVGVSALLTPWLFEISRLVFEVVAVPLILAAFLLVLHDAAERRPWPRRHIVALGLLLGALTYAYQTAGCSDLRSRSDWRCSPRGRESAAWHGSGSSIGLRLCRWSSSLRSTPALSKHGSR
jgi:4-amino-4-deoxy-L-arabinose transferase-like glycosyltransferase